MSDEREDIDYNEFYGEDKPEKSTIKKRIILIPIIIVVCVICVIAAIIVERMTPSKEKMDLYQYYGVTNGTVSVMWNNEIADEAIELEGTYYLNLDFVMENFNDRFYYDDSLGKLLYTTLNDIYTITLASTTYYKNDAEVNCNYYIAVRQEEEIFIALDFLADKMACTYYYLSEPDRIVMISDGKSVQPVIFSSEAVIRTGESIKDKILSIPQENEKWYKTGEESKKGWTMVAIADGRKGYVKTEEIVGVEDPYTYNSGYVAETYQGNQRDYDIVLVWHPIYGLEYNDNIENLLANTKGVTTVSPTWYKVKDASGEITSMADKDYVEYVQSLGMEVWPLISDFTNVEGDGWSVAELLSNAVSRRNLIENIISEVLWLECEGINIDFEYIRDDSGDAYAQFIRELSIRCRQEGIVLSTDNPPPKAYNQQYHFEVLGEYVDYVMIMGYDEYTKSSGQTGPTASYTYVKEGIEEALKMIPANKLVNGVPFYTRLWTESVDEDGNLVLDTTTCFMRDSNEKAAQLGLTPEWDDEKKLFLAEGTLDGIQYTLWLEEENSMKARMELIRENNLAGVAAWALGMESPEVWDIITEK